MSIIVRPRTGTITTNTTAARHINVRSVGTSTTVPNHYIARLMYYLSCVESVTTFEFGALSKYQNIRSLSLSQRSTIIELAKLFDPNVLIRNNIFLVIKRQTGNEFWNITDNRLFHMNIANVLSIGSYRAEVTKVMSASKAWFTRNYYEPLETASTERLFNALISCIIN